MTLDLAVEGALDCLANATRQMDVRRSDHEPLRVILNADDPVERMLPLFCVLLVASQADHLILLLLAEVATQRHDPGGEFVIDAAAGCAQLLIGTFVLRPPLPAPLVIDCAALRADRALRQLLPALVWIGHVILLSVSRDAAGCSCPLWRRVRLPHILHSMQDEQSFKLGRQVH